ncbi:MAG: asparagine synthase [Bacillota bacterium]|nr:asparagine synthase [Bacillota bacterium]
MKIREGLIPTILGTAVTATGSVLKKRRTNPMIAAGIVGFGLAHVVLGTIDLMHHRDSR